MGRLNILLGMVMLILVLDACKETKTHSVKGVITEATMNTMMIATSVGDTLSISTLDAKRGVTDGILLGDTATVYFERKPQAGTIMATKIVVVPGLRGNKENLEIKTISQ